LSGYEEALNDYDEKMAGRAQREFLTVFFTPATGTEYLTTCLNGVFLPKKVTGTGSGR